jgi:hypothetical protein
VGSGGARPCQMRGTRRDTRHRSSAVISGHQRSTMAESYAYQTAVIAEPLRANQGQSVALPPAVPSPPAISMQSAGNPHAISMQSSWRTFGRVVPPCEADDDVAEKG